MERPHVETLYVEPTLAARAHCVFFDSDGGNSIFVGPQAAAGIRCRDELQAYGITGIVNCTVSFPNYHEAVSICSIEYCRVGVNDEAGADILVYLDGATSFIHRHLQNTSGSVLVHCQMGVSRSATIVIAYLMRYQKMDLHTAYRHVKERRPCINPNPGFWKQLMVYEARLLRDDDNDGTPIITTGRRTTTIFNADWAAQSLAAFTTMGHLMEPEWLFPELQTTHVVADAILAVAIDTIVGRGCKEADLAWLVALCVALSSAENSNVIDIVAALFQDGSDFMEQWSGEVHPDEIARIMAAVDRATTLKT